MGTRSSWTPISGRDSETHRAGTWRRCLRDRRRRISAGRTSARRTRRSTSMRRRSAADGMGHRSTTGRSSNSCSPRRSCRSERRRDIERLASTACHVVSSPPAAGSCAPIVGDPGEGRNRCRDLATNQPSEFPVNSTCRVHPGLERHAPPTGTRRRARRHPERWLRWHQPAVRWTRRTPTLGCNVHRRRRFVQALEQTDQLLDPAFADVGQLGAGRSR